MSDIVEKLRIIHGDNGPSECDEAADEIERLRAEVASLKKDAERYRWLRDGDGIDFSTRWSRWRIEHWASPGPTWSDIRGHNLDAAIDAVMVEKEK